MENVFSELSIEEFLLSLNNFDNPNLIKTKLAEFVIATFDGMHFLLKTKLSDRGKLVTDKDEKLEFISKILIHCEKIEEYELCSQLIKIKDIIEQQYNILK